MTAKGEGAPQEFESLRDHVVTCSKCGFCQPVCPIFRATGIEGHVARGKVALYRNIVEDRLEIGPPAKDAFSNCLLCRACTSVCFPGIRTDDVVVSFRHAYGDRFGRGFLQRWVFRRLLPHPRLMRAIVRFIWAFRRTGLIELARRAGLVGLINPKLERALELGAGRPGALLTSRLAKRSTTAAPATTESADDAAAAADDTRRAAGDASRPRVGYWISCGYNYVLPEVGESTVRVLERIGFEVEVLDNCCCGLPAYGYGDLVAARALAKENLRRLGDVERFDAIVSECGSCSGQLKDYAHLLAGDEAWEAKADALAAKVRSFSEFVVERGGLEVVAAGATVIGAEAEGETQAEIGAGVERSPAGDTVVTYHDPCHLGPRYQNVVEQPRELLRSIPGVTFREAAESDSCCGAAGTYGVLHPETSAAIIKRKVGFFGATGASVIATECPSCMMQLKYGARGSGLPLRVLNMSQICDRATAATPDAE